jgi:hypothetical protein
VVAPLSLGRRSSVGVEVRRWQFTGWMMRQSYGDELSKARLPEDSGDYQEHDDEVGEARRGLVRRNLVSPAFGKMRSSASISITAARFLPWA